MALERLQKIISRAGVASRRKAEELIVAGRVSVNGHVLRELGSKADLGTDHIKVDGKLVRPPSRLVYLALHKTRFYVTPRSEPEGRTTVKDLLKKVPESVYPVGRLDYQSEGLLLVTNDGDLANQLTSSSSGVLKTYWVKVKGAPGENQIERLRQGVPIDGRRTLPARIRRLRIVERALRGASANSWYEVAISEGRQNQIRRMFALIAHPVLKLKRVRIGSLALGDLPPGQFRYLTPAELRQLQNPRRDRKGADAKDVAGRKPEQGVARARPALSFLSL